MQYQIAPSRLLPRLPLVGLLSVGLVGAGCSARMGGGPAGDPLGPDPSDDLPAPTVQGCTMEGSLPPSAMRRLTATEYDFAVEDLLGDKTRTGKELLPVDENGAGYASNTSISVRAENAERYQQAARRIAERATGEVNALTGCDAADDTCASDFILRFSRRALRRPLEQEEYDAFMKLYRDKRDAVDAKNAIRLFVELMLQYPSFLYRPALGTETADPATRKLTGYEIAARLSFFLWSSVPDDELLDAAEGGRLDTVAGVRQQAERMMQDPRFARSLDAFSLQWLAVGVNPPKKNETEYPEFNPEMWASMRAGVAAFFAHAVRTGGDMTALMTGPVAFVDRRLAPIYGVQGMGDDLQLIETDPRQRGGLMTQAGVMAALGNTEVSRPIKRGLFVRNRLFCQDPPPPPPEGVPPFEAERADLTIRQQLEAHRAAPSCASCHAFFDDLGLAFEHYDGLGRYHDTQHGQPIDARGALTDTDVDGSFEDAIGMLNLLKDSEIVTGCLTTQVFRFALARLEGAADACTIQRTLKAFKDSGQSLSGLFATIATSDSFRFTGAN